MKRAAIGILAVAAFAALAWWLWSTDGRSERGGSTERGPAVANGPQGPAEKAVDEKQAIELARKASAQVDMPDDVPVKVEQSDADYTVTFERVYEGVTFGPDYHARVKIDKKTGKVVELLIGS